jgi:hypothetical protein
MTESPSKQLVLQRIRNRIMDWFEWAVGFESNSGGWSLNNLINEWEMDVSEPFNPNYYTFPVFVPEEVEAMASVHQSWLAFTAAATPSILNEQQVFTLSEWKSLVTTCSKAISVFQIRGRLSEVVEV